MRSIAARLLAVALLLSGAGAAFASGAGDSSVMLQGFHWNSWRTAPWWGVVSSRAGEISAAGVDLVWLPPPSDSLSNEGYMPRRLALLDSSYGSRAQLAGALAALRGAGVRALADVVVNHRVGVKDWADFEAPAWGTDSVCSDDEWGKGQGARDTGKGFHAARDIDHTRGYVRDSVKGWLNSLRDLGFEGWRYDYARGFAPAYMLEYNRASGASFSVAEIWDDFDPDNTDAHRQASIDWMDAVNGEIKVFDFTTKGVLQQAVSSGEYWRLADRSGAPAGVIGWWPGNAVTFLDNHDTGPSPSGLVQERSWPFPSDKVEAGYAYLLTHPGIPCVYWPHLFDWGLKERLSSLIRLRRAAGLNSLSAVAIARAERDLYAAYVDGRVAVKLGDKPWAPGPGWAPAAQGPGYVVWTRR